MAQDFELPSSSEKLSSKFILDALKKPKHEAIVEDKVDDEPIPPTEASDEANAEDQLEFDSCGTIASDDLNAPEEPPLFEMSESSPSSSEESYAGVELPREKKYFRIGEVADLIGVEPHVLRYWESEFKSVKPSKTGSGQRVYAKKDVETLHYIRHLLHVDKFSIKGAKKKLNERRRTSKTTNVTVSEVFWERRSQRLKQAAHDLKEMIQMLRHETAGA